MKLRSRIAVAATIAAAVGISHAQAQNAVGGTDPSVNIPAPVGVESAPSAAATPAPTDARAIGESVSPPPTGAPTIEGVPTYPVAPDPGVRRDITTRPPVPEMERAEPLPEKQPGNADYEAAKERCAQLPADQSNICIDQMRAYYDVE